jgi:predicted metal-binding membrane protein
MRLSGAAVQRDRAVVLAAGSAVSLIAWAYVLWLAMRMEMPTTSMTMMQPQLEPWSVVDFGLMLLMWTVMMIGMMLPSAMPMIAIYAGVARHAGERNAPFPATAWFTIGYVAAWSGFSLLATIGQWILEQMSVISPEMLRLSPLIGGLVLVAAGLYQFAPLKHACLEHCRGPLLFIQRHGGFRKGVGGAVTMGLRHGIYCIGCCWGLMMLLFVGGVMNLLWIAGLTLLVFAEKLVPERWQLPKLAGATLICVGLISSISHSNIMTSDVWTP